MSHILGGLLVLFFFPGVGGGSGSTAQVWLYRECEIKRNDVVHLLHLYSISPPQTAGPGCGDERLSGGQERRSRTPQKWHAAYQGVWKHKSPTLAPVSVLGYVRNCERSLLSLKAGWGDESFRGAANQRPAARLRPLWRPARRPVHPLFGARWRVILDV